MNDPQRDSACPICASETLEVLHRQEFLLPGDLRTHYTVVTCERCGFTFARDLPTPEEYERYYRTNLKYTYEGSRDAAQSLFAMHAPSFAMVDAWLREHPPGAGSRILDIGCSTGELLALFQRGGYRRLEGVDPTPECADIARRLYDLDVRTAVLSEIEGDPYDVVLFANVFEHIPNLRDAAHRVAALVKDGGVLFVQTPDAGHFGHELREPFLELSIEHINYFTATSLANLLGRERLFLVALRHDVTSYKGAKYPVVTSLWRKDANAPLPELQRSDPGRVRGYIEESKTRLAELAAKIDALVASGEPVIVWGVGSLTARLLATTNLRKANLAGFVDSNSGHHGKQLAGREIAAPASLAGQRVTVFVSSFVYGEEIRRTLENDMRYAGRVVTI